MTITPRRAVRIGDDVLYVLPNGEIRPAKVVHDPWPNECGENGNEPGLNLVVFVDGSNDAPAIKNANPDLMARYPLIWVTSACHDAARIPGTWHWPFEVLPVTTPQQRVHLSESE